MLQSLHGRCVEIQVKRRAFRRPLRLAIRAEEVGLWIGIAARLMISITQTVSRVNQTCAYAELNASISTAN